MAPSAYAKYWLTQTSISHPKSALASAEASSLTCFWSRHVYVKWDPLPLLPKSWFWKCLFFTQRVYGKYIYVKCNPLSPSLPQVLILQLPLLSEQDFWSRSTASLCKWNKTPLSFSLLSADSTFSPYRLHDLALWSVLIENKQMCLQEEKSHIFDLLQILN